VTDKLGATILTGLQGKIAIPQKTATSTAYWLADGGSPTGSNSTLGQVLFSPKTLGAYTDITRQFVEQTSLDAEEFTRDDLIRTLAVAIDTAAFVGTGANNQPTGIVNTSGVGNIAIGTNGGDPTYQTYVSLETTVANVNADLGQMSYVTTPAQRGYLKTLARSSSAVGVGFVWQDDNTINGYPAFASNILPNNGTKGTGTNLSTSVFGNFNDLVIAQWGGLDIIVDPYTGSSSGTVRIVALQDLDIELRHAASFAYCSDLASV
jgi:HK97 family phage major capsid protein